MMEQPAQQVAPPAGGVRGYVRMAVMDGKTIGHRVSEKMDHDVFHFS